MVSLFAFSDDGIHGMRAAWGRADNQPKFSQFRYKEMSELKAVGDAKLSRRLGGCIATSGLGTMHLFSGVCDATLDQPRPPGGHRDWPP